MIDEAAYIKLSNRVAELEKMLEKLKGNLTALPTGGLTLLAPAQVAGVGGLASFDFTSISQNYSKLILDLYARGDVAGTNTDIRLTYNGDGSSIYDSIRAAIRHSATLGTGEGIPLAYATIGTMAAGTAPASTFDALRLEIPGYANTNIHKVAMMQYTLKLNTTTGTIYTSTGSMWYRSPNAISRITLTPAAGNFAQYSVARLYGVL